MCFVLAVTMFSDALFESLFRSSYKLGKVLRPKVFNFHDIFKIDILPSTTKARLVENIATRENLQ